MHKHVRLGQIGSKGQIKFHEIILSDNTISRSHGQVGGKVIQVPTDVYATINPGKANEKSPTQAASEAFEKFIYDKKRDGYQEVADYADVAVQSVDVEAIFQQLPTELCMSKPITEISPAAWLKLTRRGNIRYQVKENGLCHFGFVGGAYGTAITTRRMFDHTAKYLDIAAELTSSFPSMTMVVLELYVSDDTKPHMERFQLMGSISKSDTKDGRIIDPELPKTKAKRAIYQVRARVLAIPIYAGKLTLQLSDATWEDHRFGVVGPLLSVPPNLPTDMTHQQALDFAKKQGIEGGVLWDLDAAMELTMTGKPARRASYKVKPPYEADVLATGWVPEKNKNNGLIGALVIQQRTSEDDQPAWTPRGTVGSGIKDDQKDPADWSFPCVITIEFSERHPDTGNFQFPRFICKHPDKTPDEL